jgi:hypothetical protein
MISFDRIRVARAGLLIGWFLVSMLVVAGFASFSADDEQDGETAMAVTVSADLGRTAGAVSALAFAGTAETTSSTVGASVFSLEPSIARADEFGLFSPASETAQTDRKGGVYIRSGYLDESEVRDLIARFFLPADVNRAIRVAWCTSAFNPAAINPATGASGLFQHLPEHWAEYSAAAGYGGTSMFDPTANVAVAAHMLYQIPGGWSHWDCTP